MKKTVFVCAILCSFACAAFAADPAEGFWISIDEKTGIATAGWEFYQNNGVLQAKMLSVVGISAAAIATKCKESYRGFPISGKVNQMSLLGTPWIFGLSRESTGQWVKGNVINPEDGNMYRCRVMYHPADGNRYKTEVLEIRGEIGLGIGYSQFWQRSTKERAESLR
ncbi:MAG: DUF2147 domain-containing protein [Treponema sp.]|nr:DUF2147 domain-containing protein [Treponema sp.]